MALKILEIPLMPPADLSKILALISATKSSTENLWRSAIGLEKELSGAH